MREIAKAVCENKYESYNMEETNPLNSINKIKKPACLQMPEEVSYDVTQPGILLKIM